jgi:hypothetical protein
MYSDSSLDFGSSAFKNVSRTETNASASVEE